MFDLSSNEKLYIEAYDDAAYERRSPGLKYSALINPETYQWNYRIQYTDDQAPGAIAERKNFVCIEPKQITFDLIFDGTGVVRSGALMDMATGVGAPEPKSVEEQIAEFRSKFTYNSATHQPFYLKIHWGTLLFKGVLRQIDIQYKLFNSKGRPIRATAKCTFSESLDAQLQEAIRNNQSPDITHERLFRETDRIDLMSHDIYGGTQYYTDVAAHNGLDSFRQVRTGTTLYFPPLEK